MVLVRENFVSIFLSRTAAESFRISLSGSVRRATSQHSFEARIAAERIPERVQF